MTKGVKRTAQKDAIGGKPVMKQMEVNKARRANTVGIEEVTARTDIRIRAGKVRTEGRRGCRSCRKRWVFARERKNDITRRRMMNRSSERRSWRISLRRRRKRTRMESGKTAREGREYGVVQKRGWGNNSPPGGGLHHGGAQLCTRGMPRSGSILVLDVGVATVVDLMASPFRTVSSLFHASKH